MRARVYPGASLYFSPLALLSIMAMRGRGRSGPTRGRNLSSSGEVDPSVIDMLENLHLTTKEEELAAISDYEEGEEGNDGA